MRGTRRFALVVVVSLTLVLAAMVIPASAAGSVDVLLSDLSSPKGLSFGFGANDLVVGQGAFGPPGPVLQVFYRGANSGDTNELSGAENVVDVAVGADGSAWAIGGDANLYRVAPGETEPELIANIPEYQQTDPDPFEGQSPEPDPTGSNPYGLTVLPGGDALVADAQNNDLLRITPDGDITTVARFDTEEVSTDHLPDWQGPPTIEAEAVPTSVTLGPNGWVYVGELKGFPFRPGTSHVWAVNPDADGAVCSVNIADDDCTVALSGFTSIQDIYYVRTTGTLYVYELAEGGVLAFESGFESGDFPPAVLLEVKNGKRTELAAGKLSQAGGVVANNRGQVFVTDGTFTEGRLLEVHR